MSISILNRGASGGLKPELTVTAPSGSILDILQNSIIIDTYTLGVSETEHTFILEIGDYTVRGTLGTNTKSVDAVIDTVAQYELLIKYIDPVFANNTWEMIIEACQTNEVPSTWSVGDQKEILFNGSTFHVDIIGKNHDTYTAGGTAPLTFQMHELHPQSGNGPSYNSPVANSKLGWDRCYIRTSLLPSYINLLPDEVKNGIKAVNKTTAYGNNSEKMVTVSDKLFLLSEIEVTGGNKFSVAGEGKRYAYYANRTSNNTSHIKYILDGTAKTWWTRTHDRYSSDGNGAVYVTTKTTTQANDRVDNQGSSLWAQIAFAFCF